MKGYPDTTGLQSWTAAFTSLLRTCREQLSEREFETLIAIVKIAVDREADCEHLAPITIEGACDFFFGRPYDANPYQREHGKDVERCWAAWRAGWIYASGFNDLVGDRERRLWFRDAA